MHTDKTHVSYTSACVELGAASWIRNSQTFVPNIRFCFGGSSRASLIAENQRCDESPTLIKEETSKAQLRELVTEKTKSTV